MAQARWMLLLCKVVLIARTHWHMQLIARVFPIQPHQISLGRLLPPSTSVKTPNAAHSLGFVLLLCKDGLGCLCQLIIIFSHLLLQASHLLISSCGLGTCVAQLLLQLPQPGFS